MATRTAGAVRVLAMVFLVATATLVGVVPSPVAAAEPPPRPGGFTAVTPARVLDTRTGVGAPPVKVGPGQSIDLQVTGTAGVPATGVSAVALNVTVTEPTALGYLTVYPTGATRPVASNANFVAGQTVANAVVIKVGAGGKVALFNSSGTSHLIADVAGWHALARETGSAFTPVKPLRLLDTRTTQAIGPGGTVTVRVDGPPGAPARTAVALNLTATQPSTGGFLTVYPSGGTRPLASNLNVVAGQTRANFVAVKVANGAVDIYNSNGTTQVVVDLLGYWSPDSESRMTPVTPTRVMDTRIGLGRTGAVMGQRTAFLQFPAGLVPAGRAAAVVLNVTATEGTTGGYLTAYPSSDRPPPVASNLNFGAGETVPNLVVVPVGHNGAVQIYNANGNTHIVVDVVGWFDLPADRLGVDGLSTSGSEVAIDPTSTYAYVSNTARGRVEVLRLADGVYEAPIPVGSQPMGLDLTPDGSRLYVANRGSTFVSVVDVAARSELRRVPIPSGRLFDQPYSIAVLANGKALVTTTFEGSGFGSYLYQIDLATDAVTLRTDFGPFSGLTGERTWVRASGDRSAAVITVANSSPGKVFRYDAPTDTFSPQRETFDFIAYGATNATGTVTLVNARSMLFDRSLQPLGTVPGCGSGGVALNAAGTVGYAFGAYYESDSELYIGTIAVCDLVDLRVTRVFRIGPVVGLGRLQISPDGKTLVGVTDSGLVRVRL